MILKTFLFCKNSLLVLIFVTISSYSTNSLALMCVDIFTKDLQSNFTDNSIPEEFLLAHLNEGNLKSYEPQILELTRELIRANYKELLRAAELSDARKFLSPDGEWIRTMSPESFTPGRVSVHNMAKDHKFLEVTVFDAKWSDSFQIRTNGRVAFLATSHWYRQKGKVKHYKAVYKDHEGVIKIVDQGSVILNSMSANVPVARLMGDAEKQLWKSNSLDKSFKYGGKIHFAPNSYRMKEDDVPVQFSIPRDVLIEMYQNRQLEINTYEYLGPNIGISANKLGMEFELVIYGPEAISKIQPYVVQGLN